ncbi:MAG TPA: DUF1801 domain-containing protein [Candidatus Acidoferrum sp.]|nr:DUF1801 domain-containing protein [Candidatus Acidoferrum sp.]
MAAKSRARATKKPTEPPPAPNPAAKSMSGGNKAVGTAASKIIDGIIVHSSPTLAPVAEEIRRLVKETIPESTEAINPWGIPTFDFHGPICFMMIGKHHVTLGFSRGTSLSDAANLLQGTGKNLRHVKLTGASLFPAAALTKLIRQAATLNRAAPLTPSMRPTKKPSRF